MKKLFLLLVLAGILAPWQRAQAQVPVAEVIKAGVVKVIRAVDLQIQRQQNKVIWLQNAQKALENAMAQLQLEEITDWTEKQRALYQAYYAELYQVKSLVSGYRQIRDMARLQAQLLADYQRVWPLLRQDDSFTLAERAYMAQVYAGILAQSARHMDQVLLVVEDLATQMDDAARLELIRAAAGELAATYNDLQLFNRQNLQLRMQRAGDRQAVAAVKRLYGLP
ncbi:conjugal transfer protein TraI [Pontibacter liquoris]|uniref:conjugal transfer protein TraI n=1 Tax=Pontibacter liquoris TaxID=2905677 RepID=UPI001FA6DDB9|nr:conjugal transfer protein TraI [Pontibacter liquoris]